MMLFKRRRTRRRAMSGAAVGVVVATALVAQMSIVSNASWTDEEWGSADSVGTVSCTDLEGAFATRGEGRALSGSLLGIDLDTLAEASGVEVTNKNGQVTVDPNSALPAPNDPAYANPLNVTALSGVNVNLGNGLLQLPLDNSTGVLGQYGEAQSTGVARGASGFITDTGGIGLEPQNGYPELAKLSLSQLLATINPNVALALTNVADASLTVGAVTGRAEVDGCDLAWANGQNANEYAAALADDLTREYLAASVTTNITSPTVGALVTDVNGIVNTLNTTVPNLVNNVVLRNGIIGAVNGIVSPLLGALGLGSTTIDTFTLGIDLAPVTALTQSTITDTRGIVAVNLSAGTIAVNTSALLNSAYSGTDGATLNGLAPNTDLLSDPRIINTLTNALTSALSEWVTAVSDALTAAIDGISVKLKITISITAVLLILPVHVADIVLDIDASLATLAAGGGVSASVNLLGGIPLSLLNPILSALTSGLGPLVAGLVRVLLPTVASLITGLSLLTAPVVTTVSNLYNVLFLSGVVRLTVNAQNDPLTGASEPADWATLAPGQFDVAALRIGVLGALQENDVRLYLGRGSVGPGCAPVSVMAGGCAG